MIHGDSTFIDKLVYLHINGMKIIMRELNIDQDNAETCFYYLKTLKRY
jgi:hypothetical protein